MQCLSIDQSHFDSTQELKCLKCQRNYISSEQQNKSICKELQPIENNPSDHCKLRHPTNNLCLLCEDDFIFNDSYDGCVEEPSGIPNCKLYLTESICSWCKAGYFLTNNECQAITITIGDCAFNRTDGQCSKCSGGFKLESKVISETEIVTECVADIIPNCNGYDDFTGHCIACIQNYYLVKLKKSESIPGKADVEAEAEVKVAAKIESSNNQSFFKI